ncbi:hypothetical protein [Anaerotalea alkaliphila]|uniref:Energy-coupling factor transport system substrate-specific component n=1 Tax=Anaerotalea alkaliphila TaxID=2662126 RepID=A0A7X5HUW0_9FIRM|nr:hypothetical protein [Anaerotalea alkaliphila]NDL67108.1 hypothetical protein [Anaerotalea alkaliphila]
MKPFSQNKLLALSGMAVCLSLLSLLLFRGTTSLLSAGAIPVLLALFLYRHPVRSFLATATALLVATVFFFTTQSLFVLGYVLLGSLLRLFLYRFRAGNGIRGGFAAYVLAVSGVLYLAIRLTEWAFRVPLHQMMLTISNGRWQVYGLVILLEGLLVGLFHRVLLTSMAARLHPEQV